MERKNLQIFQEVNCVRVGSGGKDLRMAELSSPRFRTTVTP